jgi:hypothetical protein
LRLVTLLVAKGKAFLTGRRKNIWNGKAAAGNADNSTISLSPEDDLEGMVTPKISLESYSYAKPVRRAWPDGRINENY